MRTLTITLAANEGKRFETAGSYFEILTCANDLARIDWEGADGQLVDPWENVKEGVYASFRFRAFVIKNGTTPQTIKLFVGTGNGGNRAAPVSGTVAISNSRPGFLAERSASSKAYANTWTVLALAVGATAFTSVHNPAGSGVRVVIQRSAVRAAAATFMAAYKVWGYTTSPAGVSKETTGPGSGVLANKSAARAFWIAPGAFAAQYTGGAVASIEIEAHRATGIDPQEELVTLEPGEAYVVQAVNEQATTNNVSFAVAWVEVPI